MTALAIAASSAGPGAVAAHGGDSLRILVIVDDTATRASFLRGVALGAEEASRTGALFGTAVALSVVDAPAAENLLHTGASAGRAEISLLVANGNARACDGALQLHALRAMPLIDAGCDLTDSARTAGVYSIVVRPAARTSAAMDSARIELWSSTLDRFGGEQLNERFRRRFNAPMDSPAWSGWFAMKLALDLALHSHSTAPRALLGQLADPRSQFDGQKGIPLRFDPITRRLLQPVYRVVGSGDSERVVAEVAP